MKAKNKKFKLTLEQKSSFIGYAFISLWLIGFIVFFIIPMADSLIYSFSDVKVTTQGLKTTFVGWKNYNSALGVDPDYNMNLVYSLKSMLYQVPLITMFSMFIACILNQKFPGRTFARVLVFLPVIIASGVVLQVLNLGGASFGGVAAAAANTTSTTTTTVSADTVFMISPISIKDIITQAGFPKGVVDFIGQLTGSINDVVWKSGIQIILFLAGLQTIPSSYYEVSSMEGATAWEEFWKITFPLLTPMTLVCVVYSIIDSCTYAQNGVMTIIKKSFDGLHYGLSAAESFIYFLIIFIVIILVTKIVFRNTVYTEE